MDPQSRHPLIAEHHVATSGSRPKRQSSNATSSHCGQLPIPKTLTTPIYSDHDFREEQRAAARPRGHRRTIMTRARPITEQAESRGSAVRGNEPLISRGPAHGRHHADAARSGRRLNALFAISVNSPSMSMVNFPCCVDWAPISRVRGVERRVTPQPAALGMKAGDHA